MPPRHRILPPLLLAASASSCCQLAGYLCGPDRSPWPERSYATPERAVATLKEALRREDHEEIYRSLSEGFKQRNGLGVAEYRRAWEILASRVSGIHLLGDATVTPFDAEETLPRGHRRFLLAVGGHRAVVDVIEQPFWELRVRLGDGEVIEASRYLTGDPSTLDLVEVDTAGGHPQVVVRLPEAPFPELTPGEIVSAGVSHEWKIAAIEPTADS